MSIDQSVANHLLSRIKAVEERIDAIDDLISTLQRHQHAEWMSSVRSVEAAKDQQSSLKRYVDSKAQHDKKPTRPTTG